MKRFLKFCEGTHPALVFGIFLLGGIGLATVLPALLLNSMLQSEFSAEDCEFCAAFFGSQLMMVGLPLLFLCYAVHKESADDRCFKTIVYGFATGYILIKTLWIAAFMALT